MSQLTLYLFFFTYLIPLNFRAPLIFAHQGCAKIKGSKFVHYGRAKIKGTQKVFGGARNLKGARKLKGIFMFMKLRCQRFNKLVYVIIITCTGSDAAIYRHNYSKNYSNLTGKRKQGWLTPNYPQL